MNTPARQRLMKDLQRLVKDPPYGINASPVDNDIMRWTAIILGPPNSPFENGAFQLSLRFTEEYPIKPPAVQFVSDIFHPNVFPSGNICLDILENRWTPTYDVTLILTSIQSLLDDPNPDSPANVLAARLYKDDPQEYTNRVIKSVEHTKAE